MTNWQFGLVRGRHDWREAKGLGAIHGLPTTRGRAIATDGVLVQIRLEDGTLFEGHWDNFIKEKQQRGEQKEKSHGGRKPKGPTADQFE